MEADAVDARGRPLKLNPEGTVSGKPPWCAVKW
jgi:hypothetical protein